jgi:hypothetical protein
MLTFFVLKLAAIAVGLVGDICRALNERVIRFCPEYMAILCENLKVVFLGCIDNY